MFGDPFSLQRLLIQSPQRHRADSTSALCRRKCTQQPAPEKDDVARQGKSTAACVIEATLVFVNSQDKCSTTAHTHADRDIPGRTVVPVTPSESPSCDEGPTTEETRLSTWSSSPSAKSSGFLNHDMTPVSCFYAINKWFIQVIPALRSRKLVAKRPVSHWIAQLKHKKLTRPTSTDHFV